MTPTRGDDLLLDPITVTQTINLGNHPESAVENVRRVVNIHEEQESLPIFSELLQLSKVDTTATWKQYARWIKYEQVVEGNGTRFSKPHITLLNVHPILQVKNCFRKGVVLLDCETNGFSAIVDTVVNSWVDRGCFSNHISEVIKETLKAPKKHLGSTSDTGEVEKNILITPDNDGKLKFVDSEEADLDKEVDSMASNNSLVAEANKRLLNKLANNTISCSILVGQLPLLDRPVSAFVRLKEAQNLFPDLPDIPIATKFVFILLSPQENYEKENLNIGKAVGALMADEIFRKIALYSEEVYTFADAVEEFMSQIVAIPPGKCTSDTRWEPRETATSQELRPIGMPYANFEDDESHEAEGHSTGIVRTGRIFGGLAQDLKLKTPWFISDFTDFFRGRLSQSLAATMFLFFANVTSIITFGAVMEKALHHQMAAMEAILCGGISGVVFAMFSGQPLNVLSATGPTLVFEKILFDFCASNGWEFLPFRVWVGTWIVVFLLILTATDASALVGLITRFTEEAFATLISVVFIIQAIQKLLEIRNDAPLIANPQDVYDSPCFCNIDELDLRTNMTVRLRLKDLTAAECSLRGGETEGLQCHFKPDVYMLSVLLTFGTCALAYFFNHFRKSPFFSSSIRNAVSDFGVLIAIVLMTLLSHYIGLDVPVLNVPEKFRPTLDRDWIVNPMGVPILTIFIAALPAAFYTILIVMDQQITAVIINRKDNKLRKGDGYHLDLLVIAILVMVCSLLGLPYFVAATVLSVMHVDALRLQSESSAPGEKAQFLGVKEQRLTGIFAHVMIGLVVFLTPLVKLVPLPVLIGIFLYMGIVSLLGQQFVQRIALLFMPVKHQPDYSWLRCVGMKRVHLFTLLQLLSILGLFAVKYTKQISMMFPLMLVFMVLVRMFLLEKVFTKAELSSLDDPVPTFSEVMWVKPQKSSRDDSEIPELKLLRDDLGKN